MMWVPGTLGCYQDPLTLEYTFVMWIQIVIMCGLVVYFLGIFLSASRVQYGWRFVTVWGWYCCKFCAMSLKNYLQSRFILCHTFLNKHNISTQASVGEWKGYVFTHCIPSLCVKVCNTGWGNILLVTLNVTSVYTNTPTANFRALYI